MYRELGRDLGVGGRGGRRPVAQRREFLSGFLSDLGMKFHNEKFFPLCTYVGKKIHMVFVLHLPMQECKGQGCFLSLHFLFLLRNDLGVFPECMHVEGSSNISKQFYDMGRNLVTSQGLLCACIGKYTTKPVHSYFFTSCSGAQRWSTTTIQLYLLK